MNECQAVCAVRVRHGMSAVAAAVAELIGQLAHPISWLAMSSDVFAMA